MTVRRRGRPAGGRARLAAHCCWLVLVAVGCGGSTSRPELPESSIPKTLDAEVRAAIVRLYAPSPLARARAAARLGAMGDRALPAIPYLASMLRDASRVEGAVSANPFFETPDQVAFRAGMALIALGEQGEARLFAALANGTENEKRAAVYALGEGRVPAAAAPLAKLLLSNESPVVRENVPLALEKIGDTSVIPALIQAFERRENRRTVWAAAGAALAAMEDPRAIGPALKMLEDPKDATRRHLAAQMLGRIKTWAGVTQQQIAQANAALTRVSQEPNEVGAEAKKALETAQP